MAARKATDAATDDVEELREKTNEAAAEAAEVATDKAINETVPGGRYEVNGVIVDASGKRLDEKK